MSQTPFVNAMNGTHERLCLSQASAAACERSQMFLVEYWWSIAHKTFDEAK
jgi:hypothetical protein